MELTSRADNILQNVFDMAVASAQLLTLPHLVGLDCGPCSRISCLVLKSATKTPQISSCRILSGIVQSDAMKNVKIALASLGLHFLPRQRREG